MKDVEERVRDSRELQLDQRRARYLSRLIGKSADLIMEHGANSVRAIASHAVMSDPASTRVDNSKLKEIIFTDSIPYSQKSEKVKILSVADMFADSIMRVCNNESISSLYVV